LTIAHIELASGAGDLFAEFTCNYGEKLKRFPSNGDERLLIELDPHRSRNDVVDLTSCREIKDGFLEDREWISQKAALPSAKTELIIQFPIDRAVTNVRIKGPRGGERDATDKELREEGSRQVLRLGPRRYRVEEVIEVRWTFKQRPVPVPVIAESVPVTETPSGSRRVTLPRAPVPRKKVAPRRSA
jgi:hypothetical protein